MITNFKLFEQIEEAQEVQDEEVWKFSLDISKIWELYENKQISVSSFNSQYISFLNQCKELLVEKAGQESWDKLEKLIKRLEDKKDNEKECNSVWDDIYDWGDGNSVEIVAIKKDF